DLLELSQAVRNSFEQELNKKNLTYKVSGESAVVSGDQKRLHQVIFNLVSNAIKYSTEGGCINIDVRSDTDVTTVTIEDRGIGISEKDLPLIFERFYRADRSRNRKTGGAGIGLTIAKAIVSAHNGNITVESKEGYGSRFVITIPKR
nr:ATP-binding protein [Acetatifactor sp.]